MQVRPTVTNRTMAQVTTLQRQLSRFEIGNVQGLNDPNKRKGEGSYGTVYEVMVDGVPRIAKQLHSVLIAPDVRRDEKRGIYARFYEECLLLSELDHSNIVKFVGIHFGSTNVEFDVSLVMEKLDTDLDKYLSNNKNVPIDQKLSILLDVTTGLLYLHTKNPPVVHRDLTTGNVLLSKDLKAKIADFGVSRIMNISPNRLASQTKCPGTLAYMPPEALQERPVYGKALDVFSFGALCLCTIHQEFAEVFNVSHSPNLQAALERGEIEILRRKKWFDMMPADHCLRDLVKSCLQDRPKRRPSTESLKEIVTELCIKDWRRLWKEGSNFKVKQSFAFVSLATCIITLSI